MSLGFPATLPMYLYLIRFGSFVNTISFANCGVDSLIYIFRSKKMKQFYKEKLRDLTSRLIGKPSSKPAELR